MALTGFDPNDVTTFTSKYDISEPKTTFRVRRVLTKKEDTDIEDSVWESRGLGKKQSQQWRAGSRRWKILEAMFSHPSSGWDNFYDSKGEPIPFSVQNLQMIPDKVKDELIEFVKPSRADDDDDRD